MYKFINFPVDIANNFTEENCDKHITNQFGFSVIIPIRGIARSASLDACIWNIIRVGGPNVEIIVSEEDAQQKINMEKYRQFKNVIHIFQKSNDLFCKSRAINYAVAKARNEYIAVNDVDIIIPNNYFIEIVKNRFYDFFFLCKDLHYADINSEQIVYNGDSWLQHPERYPVCGGNVAFRKVAFNKIGGMYERFIGYGSEDGEFYSRAKKFCFKGLHPRSLVAGQGRLKNTKFCEDRTLHFIHMSHEYCQENSKNVIKNANMYEKLKKMPINQRIDVVRKKIPI